MRIEFAIMEADSTTIENDCYDFYDPPELDRESTLMDQLLKYNGFFLDVMNPMLKKGHEDKLLTWMKETNLIPPLPKCSNEQPECEMTWTETRVVDKYQWQCKNCKQKVSIRENSFFKNLFCTLSMSFKVILAWCQDVDFTSVATASGIKKQIVNSIYDKIEKVVSTRPPVQLGGPGSVLLMELYPNSIGDQLHPDSSKNDSSPNPKTHTKILCLADTKQVPTRYWLHMIYGYVVVQTENNNNKSKKTNLCDEVLGVLEKHVIPGGFCVLGGGDQLSPMMESLQNSNLFVGITNLNTLASQADSGMQSFLSYDIWKWAIEVCEAAQDLARNKMQSYLNCSTWRREQEDLDPFQTIMQLIADHDHTIPLSRKHSSRKK